MIFTVKDKDGLQVFKTEHESCIPFDKLDSMNAVGLTFYIDGKKYSLNQMKKYQSENKN